LIENDRYILAKSTTPPIILLQADHGSGMLTDLGSAQNTCIHDRFSPFAAYYLPNLNMSTFTTDGSNVNLFRIVLNDYFGAKLALLENKQYFYENKQDYYIFKDVSNRMDNKCNLSP